MADSNEEKAVVFRRAEFSDLTTVVSLLANDELGRGREDLSAPLNPRYIQGFQAIDQDPNQLLIVAEDSGQVVGCLQLTFIPGVARLGAWRGQIEGVRIATSRRSSGLGSRMFEWAIQECRHRGCALVQLTTDKLRPDAKRFYENLGFAASHEGMKLILSLH